MTNILYMAQSNLITVLWMVIIFETLILIYFLFLNNRTKNNDTSDDLYTKIKELVNYSITPRFTELSVETKDIVDLAVEIWRIEKRIGNLLTNLSDSQKTGMENSLRKIRAYLTKNDIEIIDYTKQNYNDGLNLDVLSIEKKAKLITPIIKETIEPTILCKGQVVKKAKVILQSK